jgi:WhiB family redox-sensing transcriptional regulator
MGTDWRDRSACAKLPKEVFFNYNSNNLEASQRREHKTLALETCKSCPVIDKCFEFAICNNEQFGIWAGLTPDQRKPFVKRFRETGTLDSLLV